MKYATVFHPQNRLHGAENRLIVPAMETEYSADGTINDRITAFAAQRA